MNCKHKKPSMFWHGIIGWILLGLVWILGWIISPEKDKPCAIFVTVLWYSITPFMGWINESTDWI